MAIKTSAQYNGGLLPDIILLTQGYYHRGTRLNTVVPALRTPKLRTLLAVKTPPFSETGCPAEYNIP